MGSVVRQFTREAGRTGLAQGKHRVNYGAAVRENLNRLERAAADYEAGVISAMDFAILWRMQMETALGATATGINSLLEGMNVLVGLNDQQIGILKLMAGSLQTTRAFVGIHRVMLSARQARFARQTALASAETAAAVAQGPIGWARIAVATGAAALGAAAGYGAGRALRSRLNRGNTIDLNTPAGQREALRGAQGVT